MIRRQKTLNDMLPRSAFDDCANSARRKAIMESDGFIVRVDALARWTLRDFLADAAHNTLRQHCHPVLLTAQLHTTTLTNHVIHVVGLRSEKQVIRVDTGRVVTLVKHAQSVWYRPFMQFVRKAVGANVRTVNKEFAMMIVHRRETGDLTWQIVGGRVM